MKGGLTGWQDMEVDANGRRRDRKMISRNLVRVLLVVFACSFFIGMISSRNNDMLADTTSLRNRRPTVAMETGRHYAFVNPDPIFASKRRVPSGPDPIHNRYVGENRRPPGHV